MSDFRYEIIPLHHVSSSQQELLNRVFDMWESIFGSVLNDAGEELDLADFFRCHSAGVISHKDSIVGFNLFTLFDINLNSHLRHHYIAHLDAQTVQSLKERKCTRLMTMEYFTVGFEWRRKLRDMPWAEILTGLGLQYLDQSPAHAVLGTPRVDLKVDQMCERLGATALQTPIKKMNYDCAVILFEKMAYRQFLNPTTQTWVKELWKNHLRQKLQVHDHCL
jgi:hypothetical protein